MLKGFTTSEQVSLWADVGQHHGLTRARGARRVLLWNQHWGVAVGYRLASLHNLCEQTRMVGLKQTPNTSSIANAQTRVSLLNMLLAILLALKNTPLSPIAGRSYEMVNVLHRWCGYTTIFIMTVHTV